MNICESLRQVAWTDCSTFRSLTCHARLLVGAADLETIGKTPMVKLSNILTEEMKAAGTLLLGKLEMQNPGGSVKDRIALHMIEDAEASGKLKPGMTVIEYTSGNTGIGIAMVCAAKGYKCIVVMPQKPSCMERYMICRQFGAEVRLTAPAKGQPGMRAYVEELLAADENLFCTSQFNNPANPATHVDTTGPEILEQSGGHVDYFVSGVGTGGTVTGVGAFFKEKCGTPVIAAEPTESRVIGETDSPHTIVDTGTGAVPPLLSRRRPGNQWRKPLVAVLLSFNTNVIIKKKAKPAVHRFLDTSVLNLGGATLCMWTPALAYICMGKPSAGVC